MTTPSSAEPTPVRARRLAWAELLRRVFAIDVLACPRRGETMRIRAAIHPTRATRAMLECLGLPSRAPPVSPARPDEHDAFLEGPADAEFGA